MKKRHDVISILSKNNAKATQEKISMYADAYMDYQEAAVNVREQGAICAHPKTGAPIDNPYLKIRLQMQSALSKLRLDTKGLWND